MHAPAHDALARELELAFASLEAALATEFAALRGHDVAALEAAAADKAAAVAELEALSARLGTLDRASAARTVGALGDRARRCAESNRINGGAIELERRLAERLLDVLRGGPRNAPLYDAGGRLARGPGTRQVACA